MAAKITCLVNDSECDGNSNRTLICLADRGKKLKKPQFSKGSTEVQAILYRADIDDEQKIDLSKTFIFDHHFNRLFAQLTSEKYKRCYTCASMSGLSPPSAKQLRQISRKHALRIRGHFRLKRSYGEFVWRLL